jgi:hypothetical protein
VSLGTVHNVLREAARRAGVVDIGIELSAVRAGLHDEIFQGPRPVLVGVDARSTFVICWRPRPTGTPTTWGVHLLDAKAQGLKPEFTIADPGQGARSGQAIALEGAPCHGDMFHIQHQFEILANVLARIARGDQSRVHTLQAGVEQSPLSDPAGEQVVELDLAQQDAARSRALAHDVGTLSQWLGRDVLSLAGPDLATRLELYDFIVVELQRREGTDVRRIRPMRVALQHQRDALLARTKVLDEKSAPSPRHTT